jgi:hypothetical protein
MTALKSESTPLPADSGLERQIRRDAWHSGKAPDNVIYLDDHRVANVVTDLAKMQAIIEGMRTYGGAWCEALPAYPGEPVPGAAPIPGARPAEPAVVTAQTARDRDIALDIEGVDANTEDRLGRMPGEHGYGDMSENVVSLAERRARRKTVAPKLPAAVAPEPLRLVDAA